MSSPCIICRRPAPPLGNLTGEAVHALLVAGEPAKRIAFLAGVTDTSVRRWAARNLVDSAPFPRNWPGGAEAVACGLIADVGGRTL